MSSTAWSWEYAAPVGRDVGGRVAAGVEDDRPVAPGEEAHLEVPALGLARELVNEDERDALPRLLVVEADAVHGDSRHGLSPPSQRAASGPNRDPGKDRS